MSDFIFEEVDGSELIVEGNAVGQSESLLLIRICFVMFVEPRAARDCASILILKRELRLTLAWHYKIPRTRTDGALIVIDN